MYLFLETNLNESPSINQHTKSLRTDLLIAADSLTSAMSSLVQQLNTGTNNRKLSLSISMLYFRKY